MQIGVGLHQVRGGGSGRQRGAWSAAVAITFHPTAQHLLAAITHTVTYCFWLQLHSYTMTHCFWLQLQGYTLFLAAVTKLYMVLGCSYTHSYTFVWLQVHAQLHIFCCCCKYTHSYALFWAAITHTVTHCFWLQLCIKLHCFWMQLHTHTHRVTHHLWLQLHSDTIVLAAITQ